ncbi:serine/threonine-protein kinase [Polyangium aurulentum]|uniref:serine/threonine-protein kinase n=1 Tax=Polyangium aurulentum TaxID=2567896 RepID=UPI0010ADB216|nr:serine/threonine-protein kinase [Polyangium aurulentum]UQA63147.1 protein kinase [Polyangium aurulentum]
MNAGDRIGGKYRLLRQLGTGAMGVVWEAVNEATSRRVAVKLISQKSEDLRYRLLREARACGAIAHRNVIEIYDVGETSDGDPFLVMQLLHGETLAELLERQQRIAPATAALIGRDIARALAAAHAASIIHRDLKPANVILHQEPGAEAKVVKVLDFGVAKNLVAEDEMVTMAGGAIGSPAYMSPEQIRAEGELDARTDIWSLGVVLFEMLTGARAFQGSGQQPMAQVMVGAIPRVSQLAPHVDPALDEIVSRCMTRELERRIGSAEELATLLAAHVGTNADLRAEALSAPELPPPARTSAPQHTDAMAPLARPNTPAPPVSGAWASPAPMNAAADNAGATTALPLSSKPHVGKAGTMLMVGPASPAATGPRGTALMLGDVRSMVGQSKAGATLPSAAATPLATVVQSAPASAAAPRRKPAVMAVAVTIVGILIGIALLVLAVGSRR